MYRGALFLFFIFFAIFNAVTIKSMQHQSYLDQSKRLYEKKENVSTFFLRIFQIEKNVSGPPMTVESLPATVGGSPLYRRLGENSSW